jgi:hypothetical protein
VHDELANGLKPILDGSKNEQEDRGAPWQIIIRGNMADDNGEYGFQLQCFTALDYGLNIV